jgi:beta-phosphoglucomutase-like phosphatase (HAD superfamily)
MRAVLLSERALAPSDRLFADAVAHLARKLGRVKPLEAGSLPADRADALAALRAWAGDEVSTWEQELARFYEEHIPVYLRPQPGLNAVVRALVADGVVVAAWSPGPAAAFDVLVHQLGLARQLTVTRIDPSPDAPVSLAAEVGAQPQEVIVVTVEPDAAATASAAGMRVVRDPGELGRLVA